VIDGYPNAPRLHPVAQVRGHCDYLADFAKVLDGYEDALAGEAYLHNATSPAAAQDLYDYPQDNMAMTGRSRYVRRTFLAVVAAIPTATSSCTPASETPADSSRVPTVRATTTTAAPGTALVAVAVGDIATSAEDGPQVDTARTVAAIDPDLILGLGDFQYQKGTLQAFNTSYDRSWGRFISRTYPINGTSHDLYGTGEYLDYWNGGSANRHGTTPIRQQPQWSYSFDRGGWHFVALNTACWQRDDCDPERWTRWLRDDLRGHRTRCALTFMHEPYWTSPTDVQNADHSTRPWIDLLHEYGVDVLLQGHNHVYERFEPQTPDGEPDEAGIQAFVVGTGGIDLHRFSGTAANSVAHQSASHGVLRLDLSPASYRWSFLASDGPRYSDEGERACH
jgi:hypothetical protein